MQELQKQITSQAAATGKPMDVAGLKAKQGKEAHVKQLFAIAAQYICLAYALQPHKEVYRKSLQVGNGKTAVHSELQCSTLRELHAATSRLAAQAAA